MNTQVHIIALDSLQQVMFRSTSGAIVTNRCQEGKKEAIQQILILCFFFFFLFLHDCLTPVAAENPNILSLKEQVVVEGINQQILLTRFNK